MTQYTNLKGRLTGIQKRRLPQLLDMLYTPAEIADLLQFGRRQFYRVYIPAGCPHQRGENGHLWINGALFHQWYVEQYPKAILTENEVYCLTCKGPVPVFQPETRQKGTYVYQASICPNCGRLLVKALSNERKPYDQSPKQTAGG
jgi:hypothetical protein